MTSISEHGVVIIGYGEHAKRKWIPIFNSLNIRIAAIVKQNINPRDGRGFQGSVLFFDDLIRCFEVVGTEALYVICSPPLTHFEIAKEVLSRGADCLVEKPCFTSSFQVVDIKQVIQRQSKNCLVVDGFMYSWTLAFREFYACITRMADLGKLDINFVFLLPKKPETGFSAEMSYEDFVKVDMACYVFDLLFRLVPGLSPSDLVVSEGIESSCSYQLSISVATVKFNFSSLIGFSDRYSNSVSVSVGKLEVVIDPLIFGRPGVVSVTEVNLALNTERRREVFDSGGFASLIRADRSELLLSQEERLERLLFIGECLDNIGVESS